MPPPDPLDEATERLPPAALLVAALRDLREEVRGLRADVALLLAAVAALRELVQTALAGHRAIASLWGALSQTERAALVLCSLALLSGYSLADVARVLVGALGVPGAP